MQNNPPQESQVKKELPLWVKLTSVIVLLGFLVLIAMAMQKTNLQPLRVGGDVPDFTLTTFDGKPVSLSELRGKIVLINFWASWCLTCKGEAAALETVWQEVAQGNEVVFLGVDYADTETEARVYLKEYSITYLNAPDLGSKISHQFRISGVPETYVIGKNGRLASIKIGPFVSADEIRAMLGQ